VTDTTQAGREKAGAAVDSARAGAAGVINKVKQIVTGKTEEQLLEEARLAALQAEAESLQIQEKEASTLAEKLATKIKKTIVQTEL
jgi:hypothetical protein